MAKLLARYRLGYITFGLVEQRLFRADLFYRLSVFPVHVPPLRERVLDIPLLAMFFTTQLAGGVGKRIEGLEPGSLERLTNYDWPGNIRELRNVLERAVILSTDPILKIDASELRPNSNRPSVQSPTTAQSLEDVERKHILSVLEQTGGAIAGPGGAAKILGIPPSTLRSRMARLGIKG